MADIHDYAIELTPTRWLCYCTNWPWNMDPECPYHTVEADDDG